MLCVMGLRMSDESVGECLILIKLSAKVPAGGRQAGMLTNIKRVGAGNPYSY